MVTPVHFGRREKMPEKGYIITFADSQTIYNSEPCAVRVGTTENFEEKCKTYKTIGHVKHRKYSEEKDKLERKHKNQWG
jgi:hypothetical protein